jgi:NADPH-dependent ferric siderophore reductase
MIRVTLAGSELEGLIVEDPAASVRMLLPSPGTHELVMPSWNGNEFLMSDGRRPTIRTFTPYRVDPEALELDLEIVVHGGGIASEWATGAGPGDAAAISGPGRGYAIDRDATTYLIGGDETAIPAIGQLLEALPAETLAHVRIEVAQPEGRLVLPDHPRAVIEWCDLPTGAPPGAALVAAVRAVDVAPDWRVWIAGGAAAGQRIRRHLFEAREIPRGRTSVRGYWKHGRTADTDELA